MTPNARLFGSIVLLLTLGSALPGPLSAQVDTTRADTMIFRIEGIRVLGKQAVSAPGGASAVEVAVDSLVLPAAPTTEELFRELPALHVRTNSRGEAEVTVRGSESRQVAVLLDGVPLTLSWDARTDVSVLPAGAISELTLVRGLSTMLHGPNVLGGVVEMRMANGLAPTADPSMSATAGLDDRGGYGLSAVGETPFHSGSGSGTLRFGASFRDSPGFSLPDGVAEPIPVKDNLRLNTDARSLSGFFAIRHATDSGTWSSLSATSFKAERGIAGELDVEEPRLWRYPEVRRTVVALSGGTGERATPWGWGDLEASLGLDVGNSQIRSYATRAYDQITGTEDGKDRTLTLRLLGDHTLMDRGELRGSFTLSDIFHEAIVDGDSKDYQQRLMSLAGEIAWRMVEEPVGRLESLRLSVGGAWDRGTTPRTGGLESLGTLDDWGARLGFTALTNEGSTAFHAGISRRGRFPALRETYSEALNRFVPNPDLHPEHLLALEGGITTRLGSGELQVVGFRNRLTDAIRRITLPDKKRMRVNSDELRSTGVEVLFSGDFGPMALDGDLTLQRVELVDPETSLSTEPENMPEVAGRTRLSFPLIAGITGSAEAQYTGSQFCQHPDTGADVELEGGAWWNGLVSKVWRLGSSTGWVRQVETMASVSNLGNTALYDQCGLPRAGRTFQFQIRVF